MAMYRANLAPSIEVVSHRSDGILESNLSAMLPSLITLSVSTESVTLCGPLFGRCY